MLKDIIRLNNKMFKITKLYCIYRQSVFINLVVEIKIHRNLYYVAVGKLVNLDW